MATRIGSPRSARGSCFVPCFALLFLAMALELSAGSPTVLLFDTFNANSGNTSDLNVDLARQTGTLAPVPYTLASGPGHYGHQLQNGNAQNQLLLADFPQSTSSPNLDFGGVHSPNGLRIRFDLDSMPTVYGSSSDHWGCINLGLAAADQMANVNQGVPHFGILFRAAGTLQAFDGSTLVSPSPEPVYSTRPPGSYNSIELLITDDDGNPFDGTGNTRIEVYANGASAPVFTFTKVGGYAHNYINLQGEYRAHFDNLEIAQLPEAPPPVIANPSFEADTFATWPGYVSANGPITGWIAAGGAGINPAGGSAPFADNGSVPEGAQVAFMQEDSALRQVLSGFVVGRPYQIRYFENARNNATRPFLQVTLGGQTIVPAHEVVPVGGSNPYHERVSDPVVATATTMELAFVKSNPQGGDTTVLIDQVSFLASGTPPRILQPPQAIVAGLGETATFSVGAVGSAPLAYQWYQGNTPLAGATSATLSFEVNSASQAGAYRVRVTNAAGADESQPVTLTVRASVPGLFNTGVDDQKQALPDNAVDPHYRLIVNADSASEDALVEDGSAFPIVAGPWLANNAGSKWIGPRFNTEQAAGIASGNGTYVYRLTFDLTGLDLATVIITGGWAIDNAGLNIRLNGTDLGLVNNNGFGGLTPFTIDSSAPLVAGVNTLDFVVQNTDAQVGYTGLRVGNLRGLAALPGTPPSITQQPHGRPAGTGQTVVFQVAAEGSSPLHYQWQKDSQDVPGATSATLTLGPLTRNDAGTYTVVVSNPAGVAISQPAVLTVRDTVPGVLNTGVDDTGAALPDGTVDPHYQLVVNPDAASTDALVQDSTAFPIAAGPWLANTAGSKWIGPRLETSAAAGGDYIYRLAFDLTGFDPATVTITGDWTTDNPGVDIYLNGTGTGNAHDGNFGVLRPFAVNSGFVVGMNTLDFKVNNTAVGYTGLRVQNILAVGDLLPAGTPPVILQTPADVNGILTETVTFRVVANGSAPLAYQWYFGPDAIPGETQPTLTFLIEFPDQAGEYLVEVSNAAGAVLSAPAVLTISELPGIVQSPESLMVAEGDDATFAVQAIGPPPLDYQWLFNGADIAGATGSSYTRPAVAAADAGAYSVRVSNFAGSVTSAPAVLTVAQRVPGVYNTGVDNAGAALPDGSVDPHYALIRNPDSASTQALVEDSTAFPIVAGPWLANTAASKWIGPRLNTVAAAGAADAGGDYVYRLVVDLTGFDPATMRVRGDWATDNAGVNIFVNGTATGLANLNPFSVLTPFAVVAGFRAGPNTIDFRVNNASPGYTGLRIENLRGIAVPLPPGTRPFIVQEPVGATVDEGQVITLQVVANGSLPLEYQWYFGSSPIPGANAAVLSFTGTLTSQSGDYSVEVRNAFGSVRSVAAPVVVHALPNRPPSFTPGANVTVAEDAGPQERIAWATQIQPGPASESGQTVTFVATADQPGLFAVAPAVSPAGTLTFTPAPDACGQAVVTLVLRDSGGTANGGQDSSAPVSFTITVTPVNDCPIPENQAVTVAQGSSVPVTLQATDPDHGGCGDSDHLRFWVTPPSHGRLQGAGANLTYTPTPGYCGADSFVFMADDGHCFGRASVSIEVRAANRCPEAQAQVVVACEDTPVPIVLTGTDPDEAGCGATIQGFALAQPPAHGVLSGMPPQLVYTPAADFSGVDTFTFTVTDGECVSAPAAVRIDLRPANDPPVGRVVVGPLLQLVPEQAETLVLACDNQSAEVVLDGTLSTDPDGDSLKFLWIVDGTAAGAQAVQPATLVMGAHEIGLHAEDNRAAGGDCAGGAHSSVASVWVTVIDGAEATDLVADLVESSAIHKSVQSTLTKALAEAGKRFAHGHCQEGIKQLQSFQDKVRHYDVLNQPAGRKGSAKKAIDHATAERLIAAAEAIIDAYERCGCSGK